MGRVGRFERRLQGMVGDASARVFGGSVVPQEITGALKREAEDQVQELAGGRQLAPNSFTVMLSPHDLDRLAGADVARVVDDLSSSVATHLADQGLDTFGEVVVFLERSEALHTGQFRTSSKVDPDASRRDAARARNAGEAPMSQQPGHPEENGHYGYDRGNPGYGQQTYAPQQGYDQRRGGYDQGEPEGYVRRILHREHISVARRRRVREAPLEAYADRAGAVDGEGTALDRHRAQVVVELGAGHGRAVRREGAARPRQQQRLSEPVGTEAEVARALTYDALRLFKANQDGTASPSSSIRPIAVARPGISPRRCARPRPPRTRSKPSVSAASSTASCRVSIASEIRNQLINRKLEPAVSRCIHQ